MDINLKHEAKTIYTPATRMLGVVEKFLAVPRLLTTNVHPAGLVLYAEGRNVGIGVWFQRSTRRSRFLITLVDIVWRRIASLVSRQRVHASCGCELSVAGYIIAFHLARSVHR